MPYAVAHFLIPVILLELFRDFFVKDKKKFPFHYIFIGGLAGLLSDADIIIFYIVSFFNITYNEVHRTFSHTLFLPMFFLILGFLFYGFKNRKLGERHVKLSSIFFVIAFGVLIHLILDAILSGTIMPFFPISTYAIGLNLIGFFPNSWQDTILGSLDAGLLIIWLVYLELRNKISSIL